MKTVLKDLKTGLLFRHMDQWTADLEEAAGFRDTLAALEFCHRNNFGGVAVVHAYANGTPQRIVGFHRRRHRPEQLTTVTGPSLPASPSV